MTSSLKRTFVSLADYVLVDSTAVAVLHYRKAGNLWQPQLVEDRAGALTLEHLGVSIAVADIYADSGLG